MGWGLLIFYVTNVTNETNVIKVHLSHFPTDFPTQKPYLCTEFQSALKLQTIKQEFQLNFSAEHKYNENEWVIT